MSTIVMPWPSAGLSPNSRLHWGARSRLAKQQRLNWALIASAGSVELPDEGQIRLALTLCPPDRRHRDLDNALAACKSGLDGLADAWHVNDRRFSPVVRWGEPRPGGAVEIEVIE